LFVATPLIKGAPAGPYELVVNARIDHAGSDGFLGIVPAAQQDGQALRVAIERTDQGWALHTPMEQHTLPVSCDLSQFQQFRFRLHNGQLRIAWENHEVCIIEGATGSSAVGVDATHTTVALDMIRVTSR
jgi:hypothetical protein